MKIKDSPVIIQKAKELGLRRSVDAEKAIRKYCVKRVENIIKSFGEVKDLNQLLEVVSSSLKMKFEEVNSDYSLQEISKKFLANGELFFKNLPRELDDKTDGVLVRLNNVKPWEPMFVAVIDCRGYKAWRAYFSKWHEVGHVLTMTTSQISFQFRRTPTLKKTPEEQIVDRVAGGLAFYPRLFLPALKAAVGETKRITFEVVEQLRMTICVGASREATLRGSIIQALLPQLLVIADYGFKKEEENVLNSPQIRLFHGRKTRFKPKLRAIEVIGNDAASKTCLRIHRNMEVPQNSIIAEAYEDMFGTGQVYCRLENLSWWKHSRGQLDDIPIWVETKKFGDRVFALISQAN